MEVWRGDTVDDTLSAEAEHAAPTDWMPAPGETLGRYVLGPSLGSGGMGVVVAAYDPKLDRKVALKLLKPGRGHGSLRMSREGRALAQLEHPAVIDVFEVGVARGIQFIAMEYAQGRTLQRWLLDERPSWHPVVEVFVQAGRGLAAAHAVGLVHRDFKPSNVIMGTDGRVRVVDFGLATHDPHPRLAAIPAPTFRSFADTELPLTRTGAIVGTPAYMAPEQHLRQPVDARTDQYSFCVALFEALYGERPFRGDARRMLEHKLAGKVEYPAERPAVPSHVRKAVLRGLAPSGRDRWPTLGELFAALKQPRERPRWLMVSGVVAAASGVAMLGGSGAEASKCRAGDARGAEVWNSTRAQQVRASFLATGVENADIAATRVDDQLSAYTLAWSGAYDEACRAHAAGVYTDSELDRRIQCLRGALAEVSSVAELFEQPDAETVRDAPLSVTKLQPLVECTDPRSLPSGVSGAAGTRARARADEVREALARVRMQEAAGRWGDALTLARDVAARAEAVDDVGLRIEAKYWVGGLLSRTGQPAAAFEVLSEASYEAISHGDDRLVARIAGHLTYVVGYQLAEPQEGLRWARVALAAADRSQLGPRERAKILANVAAASTARGDYAAAVDSYKTVLTLLGDVHPPDHPEVAAAWNNLGGLYAMVSELERAEHALSRALEVWESRLGGHHPMLAMSLLGLSAVYERQRRYDEALTTIDRALKIRLLHLDERTAGVATLYDNRASLLLYMGRLDEAEFEARRALEIRRDVLPSPHPHLASSSTNLGMILEKQGAYEDARDISAEAIEMWGAVVGPGHPNSAYPLTALGIATLELGQPTDAIVPLREAVEIRRTHGAEPHVLARSELALGRALGVGPAGRGCELVRAAVANFEVAASQTDLEAARDVLASCEVSGPSPSGRGSSAGNE